MVLRMTSSGYKVQRCLSSLPGWVLKKEKKKKFKQLIFVLYILYAYYISYIKHIYVESKVSGI